MRGLWLSALLALSVSCDASKTDPRDLKGVFDRAAAPSASSSADPALSKASKAATKPSASAAPALRSPSRPPVKGPCVAASGEPAVRDKRLGKRPACKRSNVLEWRDREQTPRYGCIFQPRDVDARAPLPLVVFFHGELDSPTAVHKKTRLRARYHKMDLTGDPKHNGFIILAPQARRIGGRLSFDVDYRSPDNLDVVAVDHFVDEMIESGTVDPRQIYAVGDARGGVMAALYAMLRPDRVAAYATYGADASDLTWSCDAPPPPAAIFYRACDTVMPCAKVEKWIDGRDRAEQPTFSMRLGVDRELEPSCVLSKGRCGEKHGNVNHNRWPAKREREMLEYLARFSLER